MLVFTSLLVYWSNTLRSCDCKDRQTHRPSLSSQLVSAPSSLAMVPLIICIRTEICSVLTVRPKNQDGLIYSVIAKSVAAFWLDTWLCTGYTQGPQTTTEPALIAALTRQHTVSRGIHHLLRCLVQLPILLPNYVPHTAYVGTLNSTIGIQKSFECGRLRCAIGYCVSAGISCKSAGLQPDLYIDSQSCSTDSAISFGARFQCVARRIGQAVVQGMPSWIRTKALALQH